MYSKYKRDVTARRESEHLHRLIVQGALHTEENFFGKRRNTYSHTVDNEEGKDPLQEARDRMNKKKLILSQRANARMATWLAQTDNARMLSCKYRPQ